MHANINTEPKGVVSHADSIKEANSQVTKSRTRGSGGQTKGHRRETEESGRPAIGRLWSTGG